jgi:hypothetical protein
VTANGDSPGTLAEKSYLAGVTAKRSNVFLNLVERQLLIPQTIDGSAVGFYLFIPQKAEC